ncbi:hypothetical protein E4U32_006398 [Claviceps aff. humidiphila group G2b]|nr:hypothetical protein E4U32_006398 [Claviceps aff. humidiphila group G2b]
MYGGHSLQTSLQPPNAIMMAGDGKLDSAAAEKGVKVHFTTFGVNQVLPLPPSALHTYLTIMSTPRILSRLIGVGFINKIGPSALTVMRSTARKIATHWFLVRDDQIQRVEINC